MIVLSKKISSMTPMEMLEHSKVSGENASKVVQYLYSIPDNSIVWNTFSLLAESPVKVISDVQVFIIRSINNKGPCKITYELLASLLKDMNPISEPRAVSELEAIAQRFKGTDFLPILMLSQGTPARVINSIASENGFTPSADLKQTTRREQIKERMLALSDKINWRNEQSGIIIGKDLLSNMHSFSSLMIHKSINFPSSFIHAVLKHGGADMKIQMIESLGENISAEQGILIIGNYDDKEEIMKVVDLVMGNNSIPTGQKLFFAKNFMNMYSVVEPELSMEMIVNYIYLSPYPEIFEIGVEELEKNRYYDLPKMTENIEMSLFFVERIVKAAKKFNKENQLGHAVQVYLTLSVEDDEF